MRVTKLQSRRAAHRSMDMTAIIPKNLPTAKSSQQTTLKSSKKGNFVKELTVEDVYDETEELTQQGAAREIMKHI